jgi:hypothetical protein
MKKFLALVLVLASCVSVAQPTTGATYLTSPNLLTKTWTGTTPGEAGGVSGGPTPAYNATTDTIIFSYSNKTAAQTYAFNQALQNAGLAIGGYDYSWKIDNSGYNAGTLTGKFTLNALNGTALQTHNYSYGTNSTNGFQTYSGTQWFAQNHSSSNISGFTMEWTGQDNRFWAGYYGPRVREPSISLRYIVDLCASNPLSSPDCPGYAQAYLDQQCTANPLYSPSCPGYAQAYLNSQCIIDSLYSRLCSGYATAYAIKYLVNLDSTTSSSVNSSLSDTAAVKASDPTSVNTTGSVSTTGNTTVDSVIATPSATSVTSTTSVTSVTAPPPPPVGIAPTAQAATTASTPPPSPPAQQAERAADNKKTEGAVASVEKKAGGNAEAAKKEATTKAKELANNMSKATTMEAQTATQGLVVGLMAYVPGFSAYQNAIVPDVLGAQVARQYHKPVVDNRSAQRQLSGSNELRWKEMVDSQYRGN